MTGGDVTVIVPVWNRRELLERLLCGLRAQTNAAGEVLGVDDGSKNVRGVPDSLEAEEKLANLVADSIRPRLIPEIEVVPWRNLNILTVQHLLKVASIQVMTGFGRH